VQRQYRVWWHIFTCVSYAEARNRYRLDVCLSVRPSVRPSVTRWYCIKTAEHIVMLSSPHDSPFILVLCVTRYSRNSDGVTPCGGAKQRWGMIKTAIFQNKNLAIANRSRVSCINTNNNTTTLKSGLEVTQGH